MISPPIEIGRWVTHFRDDKAMEIISQVTLDFASNSNPFAFFDVSKEVRRVQIFSLGFKNFFKNRKKWKLHEFDLFCRVSSFIDIVILI